MKRLLMALSFIVAFAFAGKAQFGPAATFPLIVGDTLTNVDTVQKIITTTAGYNALGVQVNVNKLSGTLSGKVYLYGSMKGDNYTLIDSASYAATVTSSYNVPTATNTAFFSKSNAPWVYWRVWVVSTTTVSAPVSVSYTLRRAITNVVP